MLILYINRYDRIDYLLVDDALFSFHPSYTMWYFIESTGNVSKGQVITVLFNNSG